MAWQFGKGGGSGGGLNAGNSVATPEPVSYAPGLNSIWVLGENLQAAFGLNHQLAVGSNQQLCINPAELLSVLGVNAGDVLTGIIGGGQAGNIQLTVGASAAVSFGQAYEINLGPDKISIDEGYDRHTVTGILCAGLGAVAAAYVILYAHYSNKGDFKACGLWSLVYQAAVDALLMSLMIYVVVKKQADDTSALAMNTLFGVDPVGPAPDPGDSKVWQSILESAVLLALMTFPLAEVGEDGRLPEESTLDSGQQQDGANHGDPR